MSGKGSTPRPIPDRKKYESEFDRIFGKNKKKKETKDKKEKKKAMYKPEPCPGGSLIASRILDHEKKIVE